MNKMWYIHVMEYYSALKNMQMNLEGIMLSAIGQTQKDKYCMITLFKN